MMPGILGLTLQPEAVTRRQIAGDIKTKLFGFVGAKEFAAGLSEEQSDTLLAAVLGMEPGELPILTDYVVEHVRDDIRRDKVRERLWELEASVAARIAPELAAELDRITAAPKSTGKTYASDQRHFAAFCQKLGVPALPASPAALAAYILDGGMKPKHLRRRLAALADLHRRQGHPFPAKEPLVRVALRHAIDTAEIQQAAKPLIAGHQEANENG